MGNLLVLFAIDRLSLHQAVFRSFAWDAKTSGSMRRSSW
jgi:hypothetical protein